MKSPFKFFVFTLLFAVVILSCVSCNETPNDTEMTDGTEVTNAPKTELYVVPNDVEISAEGYMGFTPGEIYENKVAIDEFVDTCFEDVALPNELPLKIKAFDVFDIDKWCDVNYVNLYIDYGKAKTKLQLAVADCNSEQTEKNAQIYAECLENFKKAAKKVVFCLGGRVEGSEIVFDINYVDKLFNDALLLDKAGFGNMGLSTHKLRHTAATLMYQKGHVDIRALKEVLGHSSLNTTQIYTHVSDESVKNAFEANPLANIKPNKKGIP